MNNFVIMLAAVAALATAFTAIKSALAKRRRRRAAEILDRGGPSSPAEWRLLYPGSCRQCQSRDQLVIEWEVSWQGDIGAPGVGHEAGSFVECANCHQVVSGDSGRNRNGEYRETSRRSNTVASPYLEKAAE